MGADVVTWLLEVTLGNYKVMESLSSPYFILTWNKKMKDYFNCFWNITLNFEQSVCRRTYWMEWFRLQNLLGFFDGCAVWNLLLNLFWDHSLEIMMYFGGAIFKSCVIYHVIGLILGTRLDFFCIIKFQNS